MLFLDYCCPSEGRSFNTLLGGILFGYELQEVGQFFFAHIGQGLLSAPKCEFDFDDVALFEEFVDLLGLEFHVVGSGFEADSYRLSFGFLGFGALLLLPLLSVHIFTIIHDLGNGRGDIRADFDEVQALLLGQFHGIRGLDDPELFAVLIDDLELRQAYLVVDS